jgi:hydroxyacylglutathione hydrolase
MKRVNRDGPRVLGTLPIPARLGPERFGDAIASGALVVDVRRAADHAGGRLPGTINIPLNDSFAGRAGWLVPYDRDVYLLVGSPGQDGENVARAAARDLALIGLDRVAGYFDGATVSARSEQGSLETIPQITSTELARRHGDAVPAVLDVRERSEWDTGHIPGAEHVPLGHLVERLGELARDRPLVVHCQSGGRSSVAASLLRAYGFRNVVNLSDGFTGWRRNGLPVERVDE